jgi:hypothetical protein
MKAKQEKEDAEMKRYIEQRNREKKEAELEKKKMLEQLARDKEERFGKKFDPMTQAANKQFSAYDDAIHYLKAVKLLYPTFRAGDTCKNAYSTIKVILANILKNQSEEKFRKVKQTNPNFHERVGKLEAAMKVLSSLGFQEDEEFLVCSNPDFATFEKIVAFLEEEINKLD